MTVSRLLMIPLLSLSAVAFAWRVPNTFEQRVTPEEARARSLTVEEAQAVDERRERQSIEALIRGISATLGTHRDAHAKSHGCVDGIRVTVNRDLARQYQIGFFAVPGHRYDAIARFSPGEGDPTFDDRGPGANGFALKILLPPELQRHLVPTHGETRFHVAERYYKTFDIVTISRLNAFFVNTIADYEPFFRGKGTAAAAARAAIAAGRTPAEAAAIGKAEFRRIYLDPQGGPRREREEDMLNILDAAYTKNPLAETYGSWVPSLYGARAVKYQLTPCTPVNPNGYEMPAELANWRENPNFLSEVLKYELRRASQCYKLNVQFHQPGFPSVERAKVEWTEGASPYVNIATVEIPRKDRGHELMDDNLCERASFNPAHASQFHYPIGGIQRARVGGEDFTGIYTAIHNLRNEHLNQARQRPNR